MSLFILCAVYIFYSILNSELMMVSILEHCPHHDTLPEL